MPSVLKPLPINRATRIVNSNPCPVTDSTNPGTSSPASQGYAPADMGQGVHVTRVAGGVATSNGEMQLKNLHHGNSAVTVTRGTGTVIESNGEVQQPTGRRTDGAVRAIRTHSGLAENVSADSQGFSKPILSHAKKLPLTVDVDAGSSRPGGIARNVSIK